MLMKAQDYIFITGSAILSVSIGLNAVSSHGICTAVFVAVAAICAFTFSCIRTLARFTWLAWVGLISILSASKHIIRPRVLSFSLSSASLTKPVLQS